MRHSSGFIEKCVEFLLDSEVRKLPLAHRVEFLETKGLSPEEITLCLEKVRSLNGLSQLLSPPPPFTPRIPFPSSTVVSGGGKEITTTSWRKVLIQQMGALTVLGLILTYGYHRFQEKLVEECIVARHKTRLERKRQRNVVLETTTKVWEPQMAQQQELIDVFKKRVDTLLKNKKELTTTWSSIQTLQYKRQQEVEELQSQVNLLRERIQKKIKSLQATPKSIETKTIEHSEPTSLEQLQQEDIVKDPRGPLKDHSSSVSARSFHHEAASNPQIRDSQVTQELKEQVEEVFGLEQYHPDEELSLARDYRMLLCEKNA